MSKTDDPTASHSGIVTLGAMLLSLLQPCDSRIVGITIDVEGNIQVTPNFLPLDRPARIGITSGASTPDSWRAKS